jgi:catechol 2,3-dioxygenase
MIAFYGDILGLREIRTEGGTSFLGGRGGHELIRVEEDPRAAAPPRRTTGLYHIAFLLPSRGRLALAASRLLGRGWQVQGFVDHGVSEALYLDDPDGNGVELTWDKERSDWPLINGEPSMRTSGLCLQSLLDIAHEKQEEVETAELDPIIGHAHLTVRDLEAAESFFLSRLAMERTHQDFPNALFFTKGDYHHYFAVNQWLGPLASSPPEHSAGWIGLELAADLGGHSYLSRSDLDR